MVVVVAVMVGDGRNPAKFREMVVAAMAVMVGDGSVNGRR